MDTPTTTTSAALTLFYQHERRKEMSAGDEQSPVTSTTAELTTTSTESSTTTTVELVEQDDSSLEKIIDMEKQPTSTTSAAETPAAKTPATRTAEPTTTSAPNEMTSTLISTVQNYDSKVYEMEFNENQRLDHVPRALPVDLQYRSPTRKVFHMPGRQPKAGSV